MTPAERLRSYRLAAGLTQVQAAERCDMTQGYWSHYETGRRHLTEAQILLIARRLGWQPEDIDPALARPRPRTRKAPQHKD